MIFIYWQSLKGPFPWVMIFSISIDPFFFHQKDVTVHFRSFRSFARITYASHSHDFLLFNFDHGKAYK